MRVYALLFVIAAAAIILSAQTSDRRWLAGDSHVHSHWSPGYDRSVTPPRILKGQDAIYSTPRNALMAAQHGLSWMVTTDHGGPNHAKFSMTQAYAELKESRESVPGLLQFYGMELNMPGMDHHTLIVPHAEDEWSTLFEIEHQFDKNEAWPVDPERDTETARIRALSYMRDLPRLPLILANHPSRSATGLREYGYDEPWELRSNNQLAPSVYRGMEGAPGHQAASLTVSDEPARSGWGSTARGAYRNAGARTLGGFDQMTAVVGGLWDSMLGEGRRFWIVATSDSHVHYTETTRRGVDFWPGEFHKTYVHAQNTYTDVLDGLREGRIFAVAGDLITELDVEVTSSTQEATVGETLHIETNETVDVTIRFLDPDIPNASGNSPMVNRVDLILGDVAGPVTDMNSDTNKTTRVARRFTAATWTRDGESVTLRTTLPKINRDVYLRVRGTNGNDVEPLMDVPGEDPWADLWFYSNPIFIEVN